MSSEPKVADALAEAAVAEIKSGMVVGLGTGRTASRAVRALADRVKAESLDIKCVPTSHVTETLARALQLPLIDFAMLDHVDFLFDGADEVDPKMRMLKGAGGALVRERIVARSSDRCVYVVDDSKLVDRLGQRATLSVAVLAFGLTAVRKKIRDLGLHGVVRRTMDGHLFLTDNGSLIIDVTLEDRDVAELACELNDTAGVLDHGLFLDEADEVLVDTTRGIERMVRKD